MFVAVSFDGQMSGSSSSFIKGTCMDMCPVRERKLREKERLLHLLELPIGTPLHPPPKADCYLTVKSYSRPAAGQHMPHPDELRPPDILYSTVCHLLTNTVMRDEIDWCVVYDFVFDRLRAVRQDMVIQDVGSVDGMMILEPIVRFHGYAGYRLCAQPQSKFDATINWTHLLQCLKQLISLYDATHQDSFVVPTTGVRAEMEAMYLLLGLGNSDTLRRSLQLPQELRQHPIVRMAFSMSLALWNGNYVRVCALLPKLPPLLMCVAAQLLPLVRRHALQVMSRAYSSRNLSFSLDALQAILLYKTREQTVNDCRHYGISVMENGVVFSKETFLPNARKEVCLQVACVDSALQSCVLPQLLLYPTGDQVDG